MNRSGKPQEIESERLWLIYHQPIEYEIGTAKKILTCLITIPTTVLISVGFHYFNFSLLYLVLAFLGTGLAPIVFLLGFLFACWQIIGFLKFLATDSSKGTYATNLKWMSFSYLSGILQAVLVALNRNYMSLQDREITGFSFDYLHWILLDIYLVFDAISLGFLSLFIHPPFLPRELLDNTIYLTIFHLLKVLLGLGAVAIFMNYHKSIYKPIEEFRGNAISLRDYLYSFHDASKHELPIQDLGPCPNRKSGGKIISSKEFIKYVDSKMESEVENDDR